MRRRAILAASGAVLAAIATRALPQASKSRRIAFLHPGTQAGSQPLLDVFRMALKDFGHIEGRDIVIEVRWADGRTDRLSLLATEAVSAKPFLIVTASSEAVAVFKKATATIPIVFATAGDPVEQGFIHSFARPGGNVTGVATHSDLNAKIVEVIREALPSARRLAVLVHDRDGYHRIVLEGFEPAARRFKFEPVVVRVARVEDLEHAFKELADHKADAVYTPNLALLTTNRDTIVKLALKARLPQFSINPDIAAAGGLLSYGPPREEHYRRAAALVDKILRGSKPGDLPVEQPERFHLIVNKKTARAIGVTLSPVTMLRADRIIE